MNSEDGDIPEATSLSESDGEEEMSVAGTDMDTDTVSVGTRRVCPVVSIRGVALVSIRGCGLWLVVSFHQMTVADTDKYDADMDLESEQKQ